MLQADGTTHKYIDPLKVPEEMERLCRFITETEIQPIIKASLAHYNLVRIHPFDDGNGRGARLLMNLILMQKGYPPAIIKNEKRRHYIQSLMEADQGNLVPFVSFVAESLLVTQKVMIADLTS